MYNYQTDWLSKWAYYTPDKLFLREYNRHLEWNFSEFNNIADSLSGYLTRELKLQPGQRIAFYSKNRAEYVLFLMACIKTGCILVPLNFRLTPREIDILLKDAEPDLLVYEKEFEDQVLKLQSLHNIKQKKQVEDFAVFLTDDSVKTPFVPQKLFNENEIVMILYTAGTTGLPKGVKISHRMLFWNAVNTCLRLDITSNDHTQSYAPFFHTGGWNVLFTPFLFHGASHTILQSFNAELILKLIEKEKSTILFGVPTMLQMISDLPDFEKADLSSVRYAIVGGAPMPIPLINKWHNKGIFIRQGYGLTEVGPNCYSLHQDDAIRKIGSIGLPNFYFETKIINEQGNTCANNQIGELWLRSPVVTDGYWKNDEETAKCITDGFFHTGDLVKKDDEGYFYVVDRKKNMFISGGENVYPAEIEKFLYTNDSVKEVAVVGVPDEKWGESGKAFVVLKDNASLTEADIIEFCKGNLAKYKIPKYVHFLKELPKTEAGKINKIILMEIHQSFKP
jgi:fatty-acyl-CoA synthase